MNELLAHHETRLEQTLEVASGRPGHRFCDGRGGAALDPAGRAEVRRLGPDRDQLLAVGETAAHLEVLVARGQLTRVTSAEGVEFYSRPQQICQALRSQHAVVSPDRAS